MSPTMELISIIEDMDESKTAFLLNVAKQMLTNDYAFSNRDDDYLIELAELEYARGEMLTWKDINWKTVNNRA